MLEPIPANIDAVARVVVDAALAVHRALGPGLLESVCEACLEHELIQRGLRVDRQLPIPIQYGEIRLESGLRLDLLVERSVLVELKAVDAIQPIHQAQTITYLKLARLRLALLINFNVVLLRDGIRRIAL